MKRTLVVLLCLLWLIYPIFQAHSAERVEVADLYRASKLKLYEADRDLAEGKLGQAWDFEDGTREDLTYFSPEVKELKIADGVMQFRTSGDSVTLGWGNYENQQPAEQRIHLWPNWNMIELKVKQSAQTSEWTLTLWQAGRRSLQGRKRDITRVTKHLQGTEWQTLSFFVQMPDPDGFGITIQGPADNVIEIDSVRVVQKVVQGYFRKEFTLPAGKVWRAVAEVGKHMRLYVNGREIVFHTSNRQNAGYVTTSVDLSSYLKPGKNCIAMFARYLPTNIDYNYPGTPYLGYLQGKVVMSGGEVTVLDTNESWRASKTAIKGWDRVGFDDSAWSAAQRDPEMSDGMFLYKWPGYDGRLVLENPDHDPKLFFSDAQPLQVNVRVPEGLAKEQPVLKWVLRRVGEINEPEQEIANGTVEKFSRLRRKSSLVYQVDAGLQKRGVYTLEVSLHSQEKAIESRCREPLIVVGRIPMKEVKGTSYEDGMQLTLEDSIDFTDPNDPHPWVETERPAGSNPAKGITTPRIIRKGDLVYRETVHGVAAGYTSHFSYRFQFQHPGSFYLMVLEYPNDAERGIGVGIDSIIQMSPQGYQNQSGPAIITGNKYPLTGKMQEMRWIHYASSKDQILDVLSLSKTSGAAAARVRIYRIEELPALEVKTSGERWFGLHTERARTVAKIFGGDDPSPYESPYNRLKLDMVGRFTQRLRWYLEGCENYTRYLRFTGQNLHVMGAFQYNEENNSYRPPEMIPTARILRRDIREIALRVFERNGITMMSMIEYCSHKTLGDDFAVSDAQVAAGADTISPVSREGKQAGVYGNVVQGNFHHPAMQKAYLRVIDELATKFSHSPAWKGIYIMACPTFSGPVAYARPDAPLDYDYSDATVGAFERDTGIKVPVDARDAKRFEKRYLFLTSEVMREKWIDWRCQSVHRLVVKTRDVLQEHRPDLQVLYGCYLYGTFIIRWCQSGRPYREFIPDYGMKPSLYRQDRDIWFGRYLYPNDCMGNLFGTYGYAAVWEHHVGKEPIAAYDRPENRFVVMNTVWHEIDMLAPGCSKTIKKPEPKDWPIAHLHSRYVSHANGDNAREKFTQALIGADPELVMYGFTDAMFPMGHEQQLREFARVLTALPKERFWPVGNTTDFQHNLAIRDLRKGKQYWFYVANPGYWRIRGTVTLQGSGRVVDAASGDAVQVHQEGGKVVVPINLRPFGVAAFRVESPKAKVESWSNEPLSEANLKHMRGIIADAERLLGIPKVAQVLTSEEQAFLRETIAQARADIEAGRYARAWSALTNWRFWTLWREHLQKEEKFATEIPELNVAKAAKPPKIDSKLNDEIWKRAPSTKGFVSMSPGLEYLGPPSIETAVQVAYDKDNLYLGFTMADPNTRDLQKEALEPEDMFASYDDVMVMFIQPGGAKLYQLAVNAGGLKYNADVTGMTRSFRDRDDTFTAPWIAAVSQTDKAWVLEVAIPFTTLKVDSPKSGGQWRSNFLRRFRKFLVPEMYWAQIDRGTWYDVQRYGYLNFM